MATQQIVKGKTFEQICDDAGVTHPVAGGSPSITKENILKAMQEVVEYFEANGIRPEDEDSAASILFSTYGNALVIWDTVQEQYEQVPESVLLEVPVQPGQELILTYNVSGTPKTSFTLAEAQALTFTEGTLQNGFSLTSNPAGIDIPIFPARYAFKVTTTGGAKWVASSGTPLGTSTGAGTVTINYTDPYTRTKMRELVLTITATK